MRERLLEEGALRSYETGFLARDGRRIDVSASIAMLRDPAGAEIGTLGVLKDIGERRRLEEQLRQAQKMEAVGRLAGGVAHDFNNLLTVITGCAELMLDAPARRGADPPRRRPAMRSSRRTGPPALTQQLLAFSRKQVLAAAGARPERGRDRHGADAAAADRRGHRPRGRSRAAGSGRVKADPGQLEQVIMNLVVNARDAMPRGRAADHRDRATWSSTRRYRQPARRGAGRALRDAGGDATPATGMDEETARARLRAVLHHQGAGQGHRARAGRPSTASSSRAAATSGSTASAGRGTTFKIYLPARRRARGRRGRRRPRRPPCRAATRRCCWWRTSRRCASSPREILEARGYTVLAGRRRRRRRCALRSAHAGPIHLLLTDVVMPRHERPRARRAAAPAAARAAGALHVRLHRRRDRAARGAGAGHRLHPEAVHPRRARPQGPGGARSGPRRPEGREAQGHQM